MGLQRVEHDLVAKQQQGWDTDSKRRKKKKTTNMRTRIENPEELFSLYSLQWKPTILSIHRNYGLSLKSKHIPELKVN